MSENTDASGANLDEPTDERTRGRKANQGQENLIKVIKKEKKWKEGEKIIMTGCAKRRRHAGRTWEINPNSSHLAAGGQEDVGSADTSHHLLLIITYLCKQAHPVPTTYPAARPPG